MLYQSTVREKKGSSSHEVSRWLGTAQLRASPCDDELAALRLLPLSDHRFDGIPHAVVN